MGKFIMSLMFTILSVTLLAQLNETFEGTTFPPMGWSIQSPDGGTGWENISAGQTPVPGFNGGYVTAYDTSSKKMAYCSYMTGGAAENNQYLITPQISVLPNYYMNFWMRKFGDYSDTLFIKISVTDNQITSFTQILSQINFTVEDSGWIKYSFSLSSYEGQQIYIAFNEKITDKESNGAALFIDNVEVSTIASVVESNESDKLLIYPNPATKYISLRSDRRIQFVKIYNLAGQKILDKIINSDNATLNLDKIEKGIYLIQIIKDNGINIEKIIVQ